MVFNHEVEIKGSPLVPTINLGIFLVIDKVSLEVEGIGVSLSKNNEPKN